MGAFCSAVVELYLLYLPNQFQFRPLADEEEIIEDDDTLIELQSFDEVRRLPFRSLPHLSTICLELLSNHILHVDPSTLHFLPSHLSDELLSFVSRKSLLSSPILHSFSQAELGKVDLSFCLELEDRHLNILPLEGVTFLNLSHLPHISSLPIPSKPIQERDLLEEKKEEEKKEEEEDYQPHLHNLTTLILNNCPNLNHSFLFNLPPSLTHLELDDSPSLLSSHLTNLPQHLHTLSLNRCPSLSSLPPLPSSTTSLSLSGCEGLGGEDVDQFCSISNLSTLNLGFCSSISFPPTDCQQTLSNIINLNLERSGVEGEALEALPSLLPCLVELNLGGLRNLQNSSIRPLSSLSSLTSLNLSHCSRISTPPSPLLTLKQLNMGHTATGDASLVPLPFSTSFPSLLELDLNSTSISDATLHHISTLTSSLSLLNISDTQVSSHGLSTFLPTFSSLSSLSLLFCPLSSTIFHSISPLILLTHLHIDSRELSDESLQQIHLLSNLTHLDLFSCRVGREGVAHIAHLESLSSLSICGGFLDDDACFLISSLLNLSSLNISQNSRVSDRGAASLSTLVFLVHLNISFTGIGMEGIGELGDCINLRTLVAYGCHIHDVIQLGSLFPRLTNFDTDEI